MMWFGLFITSTLALFTALLVVALLVKTLSAGSGEDKLPPGPAPWPVIGNLAALSGDVLQALSTLRKQYGDVFRLYMGNTLVVFVHGEKACKEMLVTNGDDFLDKPKDFITDSLSQGKGLFSTSGSVWKEERRFAMHTLKDFVSVKGNCEAKIHEEIQSLLRWIEEKDDVSITIDRALNSSISNVLCSFLFGKRYCLEDSKYQLLLKVKDENFKAVGFSGILMFLPWLKHLPGDLFLYHRSVRNARWLDDFAMDHIRQHQNSLEPDNPRDFIDAYLIKVAQGKGQTDLEEKQLMAVCVDIFMAGTETTYTTLIWALLFLINHPSVQTRVRTEIHCVVGESRLPCFSDRKRLPYLEATILEIQRCADVIPLSVPRTARVTSTLGPYTIPKGTTIIPVLASLHQDPDVWPEPTKFDPGRFLTSDGNGTKSGQFLPFSSGRRSCLGESLAKMELFLFLAALLQRFVFLPPEGVSSLPVESTLGATKMPKPFLLRARSVS